ncbi:hypothetical protein DL95DRAFT_418787, partial [Leptodontidium sp. 2 PMI_412]
HIQIARTTGVSDSQIEALSAGDITSEVWSNQEKALLAFVDEVIAGPELSDLAFDNARRCFSDQALVEVVTMQGFYYSLARIATVFRVDLEHSSRGDAQGTQERSAEHGFWNSACLEDFDDCRHTG